jgi:hypothetical protein
MARLTGTWEGVKNGEKGEIVLKEDGYADFIISGKSIKETEFEEVDYLIYSAITDITPYHLDFIFYSKSDEEIGRLKGIYEYINDNMFRLRIGFDGVRPFQFKSDEDEDTIILIKKTEGI